MFHRRHCASRRPRRPEKEQVSLVNRWGWTWLQNDPEAWRKKYPRITSKIDELEARIKKLEQK